jgi:hypothetical protein
MADLIHAQKGFSPWKPSAEAELVKQYQYYDIPLAGIIKQHGVRYFFTCVAGKDAPVNYWFYARVSPGEEKAFDSATRESFTSAMGWTGPVVMALAIEGPGIVAITEIDEITEKGSIDRAYETLAGELNNWAKAAKKVQSSGMSPEPLTA